MNDETWGSRIKHVSSPISRPSDIKLTHNIFFRILDSCATSTNADDKSHKHGNLFFHIASFSHFTTSIMVEV